MNGRTSLCVSPLNIHIKELRLSLLISPIRCYFTRREIMGLSPLYSSDHSNHMTEFLMSEEIALSIIAFTTFSTSVQIDPSVFRLVIFQGPCRPKPLIAPLAWICYSFMFVHVGFEIIPAWEVSLTLAAPEAEFAGVFRFVISQTSVSCEHFWALIALVQFPAGHDRYGWPRRRFRNRWVAKMSRLHIRNVDQRVGRSEYRIVELRTSSYLLNKKNCLFISICSQNHSRRTEVQFQCF